jgi:hypothetical protein
VSRLCGVRMMALYTACYVVLTTATYSLIRLLVTFTTGCLLIFLMWQHENVLLLLLFAVLRMVASP